MLDSSLLLLDAGCLCVFAAFFQESGGKEVPKPEKNASVSSI
jgi:hypothetical protein